MVTKRLWIAFVSAAVVCAGPASATIQQLDAIVAVVDEDVVLASELVSRYDNVVARMQAEGQALPERDAIMSQLMERLILETIQLQQAEQRGIIIDDETLTKAVQQFAAQSGMSIEEFTQGLALEGMSYREFREEVRREMTINRVQRGLVNRRIAISEQDVDDVLNSPFFKEAMSDRYRVGHILIAVDRSASREAEEAAGREAAEVVRLLREGADFAQMAIARSAGSTALEGGDLGWRRAGELPSLFAESVMALKQGETADPIRNSLGFHIVQLTGYEGTAGQSQQETLARHILVQPSAIRTPDETIALIEDLRRRILAGEDFAELAKEFSEDPGSGLAGGDLGWSTGEDYVPAFQETMHALEVGEISEPFASQFGWHIMEVLDRREMDMSEEARRDMALRFLHGRRYEEELQVWMKEIRDEAYVEVRLDQEEGATQF